MQAVTHFTDERGNIYCLSFACHTKGLVAETSEASDFDDEDCIGAHIACHSCSEYVFADAADAYDRERDQEQSYFASLYRAGKLVDPRADRLARLQEEDPAWFYIACKDNPDAVEARLAAM